MDAAQLQVPHQVCPRIFPGEFSKVAFAHACCSSHCWCRGGQKRSKSLRWKVPTWFISFPPFFLSFQGQLHSTELEAGFDPLQGGFQWTSSQNCLSFYPARMRLYASSRRSCENHNEKKTFEMFSWSLLNILHHLHLRFIYAPMADFIACDPALVEISVLLWQPARPSIQRKKMEVSCHSRNDWLSEIPLKITKYIILSTIMFILMTTCSLAWESAGQIWSLRIGNCFWLQLVPENRLGIGVISCLIPMGCQCMPGQAVG